MSDPKPPRTAAGDLGTADRIECDQGLYWVRLVTKQAMVREGECLQNCLRGGSYSYYAGSENPTDDGLWSLRGIDGVSIALAEVSGGDLDEYQGPQNNQPSGFAFRQLRHLKAFLAGFGGTGITFDEDMVVETPDGMTYRPDKAPQEIREAIAARRKAEFEASAARQAEQQATMAALYDAPRRTSDRVAAILSTDIAAVPATRVAPEYQNVRTWRGADLIRAAMSRMINLTMYESLVDPEGPTFASGIDFQEPPPRRSSDLILDPGDYPMMGLPWRQVDMRPSEKPVNLSGQPIPRQGGIVMLNGKPVGYDIVSHRPAKAEAYDAWVHGVMTNIRRAVL